MLELPTVLREGQQHLASKGINIQPLMKGLSRTDEKAVKQALIEVHGLGKIGGTLLKKTIVSHLPTQHMGLNYKKDMNFKNSWL